MAAGASPPDGAQTPSMVETLPYSTPLDPGRANIITLVCERCGLKRNNRHRSRALPYGPVLSHSKLKNGRRRYYFWCRSDGKGRGCFTREPKGSLSVYPWRKREIDCASTADWSKQIPDLFQFAVQASREHGRACELHKQLLSDGPTYVNTPAVLVGSGTAAPNPELQAFCSHVVHASPAHASPAHASPAHALPAHALPALPGRDSPACQLHLQELPDSQICAHHYQCSSQVQHALPRSNSDFPYPSAQLFTEWFSAAEMQYYANRGGRFFRFPASCRDNLDWMPFWEFSQNFSIVGFFALPRPCTAQMPQYQY